MIFNEASRRMRKFEFHTDKHNSLKFMLKTWNAKMHRSMSLKILYSHHYSKTAWHLYSWKQEDKNHLLGNGSPLGLECLWLTCQNQNCQLLHLTSTHPASCYINGKTSENNHYWLVVMWGNMVVFPNNLIGLMPRLDFETGLIFSAKKIQLWQPDMNFKSLSVITAKTQHHTVHLEFSTSTHHSNKKTVSIPSVYWSAHTNALKK